VAHGASEKISGGMAQRYAPTILLHAALIVVWYLVIKFVAVPSFILPSPVATVATLAGKNYNWISNSHRSFVGTSFVCNSKETGDRRICFFNLRSFFDVNQLQKRRCCVSI